jgi:glycerol-3-phosphate cytidylyltransferase-like family protein
MFGILSAQEKVEDQVMLEKVFKTGWYCFEKMRLEMMEKERPIYNVIIGEPVEVDINEVKKGNTEKE